MDRIAEAIGKAEDPAYWRRPYVLEFSRRINEKGFNKYLTGFGLGSHLGYLEDLTEILPWIPFPDKILRYWRPRPSPQPDNFLLELNRLPLWALAHPGLRPPFHRLLYPLLCVLKHHGIIRDLRHFYPAGLYELAENTLKSGRFLEAILELKDEPLEMQLKRLSFSHLNSSVDITRHARLSRQAGAVGVSPAFFPSCIPLTHLPCRAKSRPWGHRRSMRPGKFLLQEAMRGRLPDEIIMRRKYWPHPGGSPQWRGAAIGLMESASPQSLALLKSHFGPAFENLRRYFPQNIIPLAFWHHLIYDSAQTPAEANDYHAG
ncbi:MAG: hypothetical protein A3J74_00205 [Elusimicrobia bacterium RIFCSPHIGHO2_02_FULL_57_9]|nr:MAG: hypothetical protein A3J74_00205 [Elusimicrobia bacterium RIFCSPHIGHO2_02_FULL_57_9]